VTKVSAAAPIVFATGFAALMLWLAGDPFGPRLGDPPFLTSMTLTEPHGDHDRFPRAFAWAPVTGAQEYEITVTSPAEKRLLFRQRGTTTRLDLQVAAGAEPPPGSYVWEVVALRGGLAIARGEGRFAVSPARRRPAGL
jgi:hypothetical protein